MCKSYGVDLLSLLFTTLALAQTPTWYALPLASYDTDEGLGGGLRAEYAIPETGLDPYKSAWMVHLFASNTGFHHHRVRYDRLGLGARGLTRFTARLAWRQWLRDGYWGVGGDTVETGEDPLFHRYALFQPFAYASLRRDLSADSPWSLFAAFNPKYSSVKAYDESLLAQEQPYGVGGGPSLQGLAGVLYDSRAPEVASREGVMAELSARVAPGIGDESGSFGGLLLSVRGFAPLGGRVTLAGRVMGEQLFGEVPFYEMAHWGGFTPLASGAEILRGVKFGRWRDRGKAVLSGEVRVIALTHSLAGKPFEWELTPFTDVGVFFDLAQAGGGAPALHPAAGIGLRPIYNHLMVGRMDLAWGLNTVEGAAPGSQETALNTSFYLTFEHPY